MGSHILTIREKKGTPFPGRTQAGVVILTPVAQIAHLQLPGFTGGLIWNRPVAVLVQTPDGAQERLPVRDLTRIYQLAILGAGLLSALLFAGWLRKSHDDHKRR